jgi:hypothetical protein
MTAHIAKMMIISGIILVVMGVFFYFFGKSISFGRLPGDILIKKENFMLYLPITTCLMISLILSLLLYLWNQK